MTIVCINTKQCWANTQACIQNTMKYIQGNTERETEVETAFKVLLTRCWQTKTRCCLELFLGKHQNLSCTQNRKDVSTLFLVDLTDFFSKHTALLQKKKNPFRLHKHLLFNQNTTLHSKD